MCFWTQATFKWNNLLLNTSKFCQNERVTHFLQSWKILLWGTGVVEFVAPHDVVNVWHWNPVAVLKSRKFSKISCFVWFICQKLRAVFSSISAQNCSRKKYSFWRYWRVWLLQASSLKVSKSVLFGFSRNSKASILFKPGLVISSQSSSSVCSPAWWYHRHHLLWWYVLFQRNN